MLPFDFITIVAIVCARHGGSVTSWGRTPARNKAVGGHPNSYHLTWQAADVVLDNMTKNIEFEADCKRFKIKPLFQKSYYHLEPEEVR